MVRDEKNNDQFNDFSLEDLADPRGVIPTSPNKGKKGGRASRKDEYYGKKWYKKNRNQYPEEE